MQIHSVTDLGHDALLHPKKYKAFMGVSIRNRFFTKKIMCKYISWGSSIFNKFALVIIDYPDRYNLMAFKGLSEKKALERVLEISATTKASFEKIIKKLNVNNIVITDYYTYQNTEAYASYYKNVAQIVKDSSYINRLLYEAMYKNIGYKIKEFIATNKLHSKAITDLENLLHGYIFDELIILIYLTEKLGYTIEVDPYNEFVPKKVLYDGETKNIFSQLSLGSRGHIFALPI